MQSEYGSDEEGYVGLQERINRLANKTPDRFRRTPALQPDNGQAQRRGATRARR